VTLPKDDLETLLDTVRLLYKLHYKGKGLNMTQLAIDAKVSVSTISLILKYPEYRPGRYVEDQLRAFIKRLKQKCPEKVQVK